MFSTEANIIHICRLHDNPALLASLEPLEEENDDSRPELRPVFVLDPWFVANMKVGPNRWRFLQESLENLDSSLRKLGSRLFVIRGKPRPVFESLFEVKIGLQGGLGCILNQIYLEIDNSLLSD